MIPWLLHPAMASPFMLTGALRRSVIKPKKRISIWRAHLEDRLSIADPIDTFF